MNLHKPNLFVLLVLITPWLSACTFGTKVASRVLLGIDFSAKRTTQEEIMKQAQKYNIDSDYNMVLDTGVYFSALKERYDRLFDELVITDGDSSEYMNLKQARKDDSQPVQLKIFDRTGAEIFKLVNCYLTPPIPMNWNVDGCLDHFPPRLDWGDFISHKLELDFLLQHATSMDNQKITMDDLPQTDYYAVILWNDFLIKPSKKLIQTFKEKREAYDASLTMIYINNHNAYLGD